MPPSYRLIDYRIRPAKHAERIMLCEAFHRLRFHCLEDYQYVGLGSLYFTDFRLMHRALGMTQLFSIERQAHDAARFEWNKPYRGIEILFGDTEERLSDIDFSLPTIAWLDYDDPLKSGGINDTRSIAHSASHGSMLVVTINAQPRQTDERGADMLDQVRAELGAVRIPTDVSAESLRGWGLADLYRQVVSNEIRDALSNANAVRPDHEHRSFEQLFYLQYEDGARMATIGGVFFDSERRGEFDACCFDRLQFVKRGSEPFRISTPKLTLREIAHLEQQLPLEEDSPLELGPIPQKDAEVYRRLYRYLPAYLPVDLL